MTTATWVVIAIIVFVAAGFYGRKLKEQKDAEEEVSVQSQHELDMIQEVKENQDAYITVSDRIEAYIKDCKFSWIKVDGTTYPSYTAVLAGQDLDKQEMDDLMFYNEHLKKVRTFKNQTGNKAVGYRSFVDVLAGEIKVYDCGTRILGDRNHMAVDLNTNESGDLFITKIYLSVDLMTQVHRVYDMNTEAGTKVFRQEILNNEAVQEAYAAEFQRLDVLREEIEKYNKHRHALKFNAEKGSVEYHPEVSAPLDNVKDFSTFTRI